MNGPGAGKSGKLLTQPHLGARYPRWSRAGIRVTVQHKDTEAEGVWVPVAARSIGCQGPFQGRAFVGHSSDHGGGGKASTAFAGLGCGF